MVTDAATLAVKDLEKSNAAAPVFVCLTNIPTPYRVHFFSRLSEALETRGWKFEAWFMARSERGRHWTIDQRELPFRSVFLGGVSLRVPGAGLHSNPGVAYRLAKSRPRVLMMAGSWAQPTNIAAAVIGRLRDHAGIVFWSESHLKSMTRTGWLMNVVRRLLLSSYDSFAIPGRLAREYVDSFAPGRKKYSLANTVNEFLFRDRVAELRANRSALRDALGIADDRGVMLIPARLSPDKGILPFLEGLWCCRESIEAR